jgi:hypothetical protein
LAAGLVTGIYIRCFYHTPLKKKNEKANKQKEQMLPLRSNALFSVRVHGPYSLSKDALREEGYPWLIKSTRQ